MKKKIKLTPDEDSLLESIESGEWHSADDVDKERLRAQKVAKQTLKKDMRINIRVSSVDLERIKRIAAYEGLPYQTLIASVLHKYAAGHLK